MNHVAAAFVVATLFYATSAAATPSSECASWRGDVDLGRLTWNIGVTRTAPGVFSVDVPSMWRDRDIVHGSEKNNRITLELPYELGKLDGAVVRCILVAKIQLTEKNAKRDNDDYFTAAPGFLATIETWLTDRF